MEGLSLLDTLKSNRLGLLEELKKNYKYDYLKTQLYEMEKNIDNFGIIRDLFLGNIGIEANKQLAFYELPTFELLSVIQFICQFTGINNIEELGCGIGLLSAMLKHHYNNLTITATDGDRWIETTGKKYYNVTSKLFLEYCLNQQYSFNDKILLISWIPKNEMNDFITLIQKKKPTNIIIIGNMLNSVHYDKLYKVFTELHYKFCGIPVKQICYKDHYLNNKFNSVKSCTLFATRNGNLNLTNLLLDIKTNLENCLVKKVTSIGDIEILQDILIKEFEANFLISNLNESTYKDYYKEIYYMLNKKITIPKYIETYNEYKFWFNKIKHGKFPLLIDTRDKFNEYKGYIDKINEDNGVHELKSIGVLPEWINNTTTVVEKFFYLEFSTNSKKWKRTREAFADEFRIISSRASSNRNTVYMNNFINI